MQVIGTIWRAIEMDKLRPHFRRNIETGSRKPHFDVAVNMDVKGIQRQAPERAHPRGQVSRQRPDRSSSSSIIGGGLTIIHRNTLTVRHHPVLSDVRSLLIFELQLVRIWSVATVTAVANIYRRPTPTSLSWWMNSLIRSPHQSPAAAIAS